MAPRATHICYHRVAGLTVDSKQYDRPDVDHLILVREARGLTWSLWARLLFVAPPIATSMLQLLGLLPTGVVAQNDPEAAGSVVMLSLMVGIVIWALYDVAHLRRVGSWGLAAVFIDMVILTLLPILWVMVAFDGQGPPVHLVKNELFTITTIILVVNTLPLRGRYPLLLMAFAIAEHGFIYASVLSHPQAQFTDGFIEHFTTAAVAPGVLGGRLIAIALIGGFLSRIANSARQTIRHAVHLEAANHEIRERQAQLLMEGRLSALGKLVAGVAHEMNTPLGALKSSISTASEATQRLKTTNDDRRPRLFTALDGAFDAARRGAQRLQRLTDGLRRFAKLDEADVQPFHLHEELDNMVALLPADRLGAVVIARKYADIQLVNGRPRELNQVFMALLDNALEALAGRGTLRLETEAHAHEVVVHIADDGPGISPKLLTEIFDLRFGTRGARVTMGLGLPLAQRIMASHGGRIDVQSELGGGSRFTVRWPRDSGNERGSGWAPT